MHLANGIIKEEGISTQISTRGIEVITSNCEPIASIELKIEVLNEFGHLENQSIETFRNRTMGSWVGMLGEKRVHGGKHWETRKKRTRRNMLFISATKKVQHVTVAALDMT